MDEIDAAVDSTYRAAIAALIQRQANDEQNPTQFITSTFRPELVSVAARTYGISHQSKVSNIHLLTKKDALSFVSNLQAEEENVTDSQNNSQRVQPSAFAKNMDESEILSDDDESENESPNVSRKKARA